MSHRPKHRNKYFEFVEHTKPSRRRGRHELFDPEAESPADLEAARDAQQADYEDRSYDAGVFA